MLPVSLILLRYLCVLDADCYASDERSAGVWDDFHIVDGRLITGQNPQSSSSTAKAVLEVFETL